MFLTNMLEKMYTEDTVSKECEDDEVDGGEHPTSDTSLRLYAMVHHSVPVLTCQNLRMRVRIMAETHTP